MCPNGAEMPCWLIIDFDLQRLNSYKSFSDVCLRECRSAQCLQIFAQCGYRGNHFLFSFVALFAYFLVSGPFTIKNINVKCSENQLAHSGK